MSPHIFLFRFHNILVSHQAVPPYFTTKLCSCVRSIVQYRLGLVQHCRIYVQACFVNTLLKLYCLVKQCLKPSHFLIDLFDLWIFANLWIVKWNICLSAFNTNVPKHDDHFDKQWHDLQQKLTSNFLCFKLLCLCSFITVMVIFTYCAFETIYF